MGFLSVLSFSHQLVEQRLRAGEAAIDATAGTGADTLFLARICGKSGNVFSFDIQAEALSLTQARLNKEDNPRLATVTLLQQSHAEMLQAVPAKFNGHIGAVMFNLGYLPADGADHRLITVPESTLPALESAVQLLRPRGILTIVLYPGHPGGDLEAAAVETWASELSPSIGQTVLYRHPQKLAAPYVIAIEKGK